MKQADIKGKSTTLAYLDKILVSHVTPVSLQGIIHETGGY